MGFIPVEHFWYKDACWDAAGRAKNKEDGVMACGKGSVVLGHTCLKSLLSCFLRNCPVAGFGACVTKLLLPNPELLGSSAGSCPLLSPEIWMSDLLC